MFSLFTRSKEIRKSEEQLKKLLDETTDAIKNIKIVNGKVIVVNGNGVK